MGTDPRLEAIAQSNVDVIEQCLNTTPEDHAWEVNEEWLTIEYGERAACDLAAFDAQRDSPMAHFAVFTALRYGHAMG